MNSNSYMCSVCGVPIKRQQKQTLLAQRENIVSESVCENDHICKSCCKLAVQCFKETKASIALEMEVFEDFNGECSKNGDNNICLMCDTTLSIRESLLIIKPDPTELDHLMLNLISEAIPPQTKIGSEDKVCSKCWSKVRRSAIHLQQINKSHSNGIGDGNQSVEIKSHSESDQDNSEYSMGEIEDQNSKETEDQNYIIKSEHEDSGDADYSAINDIKDELPDFTVNSTKNELKKKDDSEFPDDILLLNYNRCAASSSKCLFRSCNNPERKQISDEIREKVLRDYKFYIPRNCRACQQHLQSNNWHDLCSPSNIKYKFNTKQIEHMFSMVQTTKNTDLDFNNVLNFDDYFIKHLLGIKREVLAVILTSEPKITKMCNGLTGLLGLLLKHENGGSDIRITTLLKISRTTLKRAMEDVKKILSKSQVTKELGIEYLLTVK